MQPWSPKRWRWAVVHDHTVLISAAVFQTWSQFFILYLWNINHLPHFSSKTPNTWITNSKVFVLSYNRQFFDHHNIRQWSKQQVPPTSLPLSKRACVGVDDSSCTLWSPSDKISTPITRNNEDGSLSESVDMIVWSRRLGSNHGPEAPPLSSDSSHRTWSKALGQTNLRQALQSLTYAGN